MTSSTRLRNRYLRALTAAAVVRLQAPRPAAARRHGGGGIVLRLQTRCVLDVFVFIGRTVLRPVVGDGLELIRGLTLRHALGLVLHLGLGRHFGDGLGRHLRPPARPSRRTGWAGVLRAGRATTDRQRAGILVDNVDVEVVRFSALLGHSGDDDHRTGPHRLHGATGSTSSMSSNSSSFRLPVGIVPMPGRRAPLRLSSRDLAPLLSTRVASATSLVRRTASRLLMSIGTNTNSQSTTSEIQSNDWGMLGMVACSFPVQARSVTYATRDGAPHSITHL